MFFDLPRDSFTSLFASNLLIPENSYVSTFFHDLLQSLRLFNFLHSNLQFVVKSAIFLAPTFKLMFTLVRYELDWIVFTNNSGSLHKKQRRVTTKHCSRLMFRLIRLIIRDHFWYRLGSARKPDDLTKTIKTLMKPLNESLDNPLLIHRFVSIGSMLLLCWMFYVNVALQCFFVTQMLSKPACYWQKPKHTKRGKKCNEGCE